MGSSGGGKPDLPFYFEDDYLNHFQGYAATDSFQTYKGTIPQPLASFTICMRIQVKLASCLNKIYTFSFRLTMSGRECTSSPMPPPTRVRMSSMQNTISAGEHSELAKKEPSSVGGTGICLLFTTGSTYVRTVTFYKMIIEMIFTFFRFAVQCYEGPVQSNFWWWEGWDWVLVRQSLCKLNGS